MVTKGKTAINKKALNELVSLVVQGDEHAFNLLVEILDPTMWQLSRLWTISQYSPDDVHQELLIKLHEIVHNYKPELGNSFTTFATACFKHAMISLLKVASRTSKKEISNMEYESETGTGVGTTFDHWTDYFIKVSDDEVRQRDAKLDLHLLLEELKPLLTESELRVLNLYIQGLAYKEIVEALRKQKIKVNDKHIDNCIERIKGKARFLYLERSETYESIFKMDFKNRSKRNKPKVKAKITEIKDRKKHFVRVKRVRKPKCVTNK